MITLKQGEAKIISLRVIKEGVAVDLSSCPNIKAIFSIDGVISNKYALVDETDYGKLTVNTTTTNQVDIVVERSQSANFPPGLLKVVLLIAYPDAAFADGERPEEEVFLNVARIQLGISKEEEI